MTSKPIHPPLEAQAWATAPSWERLDDLTLGVFDCPHSTPKLTAHGPFVVRSQDIRTGVFRREDAARVSEETYEERIARAEPRFGDLLYSREGTYFGIAAEVPKGERVCLGQRMVLIRPRPERVDARFLRYWLNSPVMARHLEGFRDGSVAERLNLPTIRGLAVPTLPLAKQRAIAAVLGALDDKIELNRRMNRTLEAMARALFRSWFVDFDPVHAKAEGRAPVHMDPATAALFPDRFGGDGLPEMWVREPIGRHVSVCKGLSYKGEGLREEGDGVPLHNLNSIYEGGGYKDGGIKFYQGEHRPRHEVRPGDLIVANTEQGFDEFLIGHSAMIPEWLGPSGLFSHHLYKVEPKVGSPLSREWWYLALSCSWIGARIRSFSNGTTVNMLPSDAFELPIIPVPPKRIVDAMDSIVRPMLRKQDEGRVEARTLAALRDALLPKLMSGELRVRDAERALAEAV